MEKLVKNNNCHELLILFKENGGFFHENLKITRNTSRGFGIIANEDIKSNEILIEVPHSLLIPVDEIKNLKKFKNKFDEIFFKNILENDDYLKVHPLNSNNFELEKIIHTIKNNENLKKNFLIKFENFNSLNEENKKIKLLSSTRAIFIKTYNKRFFMPIMDFVNYHYDGLKYLTNSNGDVFIKTDKKIKKNQEILISYTSSSDAISFFFKHGFVDESFNSFRIKKNELRLKLKSISTFNKNFFLKEDDIYTFKESIYFYGNNNFSKNIFKFLEIFPLEQRKIMFKKILNMYKNSIYIDDNQDFTKNSTILKNFYQSVKLYKKIIDSHLELLI